MLSNCFCCISQSQSQSQRLSTHSALSRYSLIMLKKRKKTGLLSIRLTSIWQIIGRKIFSFISHSEDIHLRAFMQMIPNFFLGSLILSESLSDLRRSTGRRRGSTMAKLQRQPWQTIPEKLLHGKSNNNDNFRIIRRLGQFSVTAVSISFTIRPIAIARGFTKSH